MKYLSLFESLKTEYHITQPRRAEIPKNLRSDFQQVPNVEARQLITTFALCNCHRASSPDKWRHGSFCCDVRAFRRVRSVSSSSGVRTWCLRCSSQTRDLQIGYKNRREREGGSGWQQLVKLRSFVPLLAPHLPFVIYKTKGSALKVVINRSNYQWDSVEYLWHPLAFL